MKIKNVKKFIKGLLIVLSFTILLILLLTNTSFSHKEISYKTIYVSSGDTLWGIAEEQQKNNIYYEGKDLRQIVNSIKSINNLSSSNLKIGQKLLIAE